MSFTIGSLFDGSGGFPLAATLCGGIPKWASEVEPYPIAVTKSRFPTIRHLGSVTDIKGSEVEPVDVISFGSPCQDLSVAGKRAGLKHTDNGDDETTRSGLFMEAIRIIKEMREATNGVYPRFALWENVPGAFSSNKGEDFRIVLQELIQVAEPTAVMPEVPKNGWPYADSYSGEGWSLSYRTLDAQYWGVPQRRRRIYLVADFRGECAGKVSFERESLRGYFETGRTPWQTVAGDAEAGSRTADCERKCVGWPLGFRPENVRVYDEVATTICNGTRPGFTYGVIEAVPYTLEIPGAADCERNGVNILNPWDSQGNQVHDGTGNHIYPCLRGCGGAGYQAGYVLQDSSQIITLEPGIAAREGGHIYEGVSGTLRANAGDNQMAVAHPICMATQQGGAEIMEDKCPTITASAGMSGNNQPVVCYPNMVLDDQGGSQISVRNDGKCPTLRAETHGNLPCVLSIENHPADSRVNIDDSGKVQTLTSRMGTGGGNVPMVMEPFTSDAHHAVAYWDGGQTMATLTANNAGGNQRMPDKENFNCVIETRVVSEGGGPVVSAAYVDTTHADDVVRIDSVTAPLQARDYKGGKLVQVQYIVRRLTPSECARLQGFPDTWGHPIEKTELTDDEYQFWLNVRNTHAAINEKATKDYTKEQMLKWYNGLHTDSSEYKMWGNGIALPNALYMMQGIADVMSEEKAARKKWLYDLLK